LISNSASGFGPADRLMLDGGRGQDARAPGGVNRHPARREK